jgi:chromosome segregation ATPase
VNAKMLTKLLEQTKTDARRIQALEAQAVVAVDDKNRTVDATVVFWKKRLDELKAQHLTELRQQEEKLEADRQHVVEEVQALTGRVIAAKGTHGNMTKALTEARDHISLLAVEKQKLGEQLAAANARMADVEPRIALLEQQRVDLEKICDKVRDRMKRREQEEERAVLNRKALVSVAPQRDYRR